MSFEQQQQPGGKGGVVVRDEASCVVQASSGDSGSTLKAHDYIGLSEVTSMPLKVGKNDKALPDLNLGETELRLGPPKSPPAAAAAAAAGSGAGQGASLKDAAGAPKNQVVAADTPSQQQKWHEKLASGNGNAALNMYAQQQQELQQQQQQKQKQSSQEHNGDKNHEKNEQQQAQQQQHHMNAYSHAVAAAIAAKNNNTVAGAKRGFLEAIGNGFVEGRSVMPSIGASGASAAQNGKMPSMYPWSASKQLPVAWRMGLEQSKGSFGPFPSSQPMQQQQQQQNKDAGGANRENTWDSSSSPASKNGGFGLSSSSTQKNKEEDTSDEVAPSASPPVVGWPPVQSFRKNTLAAHPPPPQKSTATTEAKTSAPVAPAAAPSSASAAPTASNIPLFVKVYMDGVPIGRKVDLKTHNSYEKLSSVLEEMFHRFITGQNGAEVCSLRDPGMSNESKKLNFLHGSEFVLTYEDKDGDLMLVGDVPWGMFTGTVKRLRIMKGSEAIGLAPPQPQAAADKKIA